MSPRSDAASTTLRPSGTCTSTRIGWMNPATPIADNTSSPSPPSVPVGHQWRDGSPILMKNTGSVRIAMIMPP